MHKPPHNQGCGSSRLPACTSQGVPPTGNNTRQDDQLRNEYDDMTRGRQQAVLRVGADAMAPSTGAAQLTTIIRHPQSGTHKQRGLLLLSTLRPRLILFRTQPNRILP